MIFFNVNWIKDETNSKKYTIYINGNYWCIVLSWKQLVVWIFNRGLCAIENILKIKICRVTFWHCCYLQKVKFKSDNQSSNFNKPTSISWLRGTSLLIVQLHIDQWSNYMIVNINIFTQFFFFWGGGGCWKKYMQCLNETDHLNTIQ